MRYLVFENQICVIVITSNKCSFRYRKLHIFISVSLLCNIIEISAFSKTPHHHRVVIEVKLRNKKLLNE